MDDAFFDIPPDDDDDLGINNEAGGGQEFGPNDEQLLNSPDQVQQEETNKVPPQVSIKQTSTHHVLRKKHDRSFDTTDENLVSKKHKSKKTSNDARQLTKVNAQKPPLPTLLINPKVKEKGSCSNPLTKETLAFGVRLVVEWLSQNCANIAKLETLPNQLKSTKLDLKKATDKLATS